MLALNLPELRPVRVIWLIENVCLWRNLPRCQCHLLVAKEDLQGSSTAWLPANTQLIISSSQSHSRHIDQGPSNGMPAPLSCQIEYMNKSALGERNAFYIAANIDKEFKHALNSSLKNSSGIRIFKKKTWLTISNLKNKLGNGILELKERQSGRAKKEIPW